MRVWRISEIVTLDGEGGIRVPGRWSLWGRPVVYTAASRALAMLETIVHLERAPPPRDFQLLELDIPDDLASTCWDGGDAPDIGISSAWGQDWLIESATALARVPSIVSPGDANWLINPLHRDAAEIRIVTAIRHPWDARLFN